MSHLDVRNQVVNYHLKLQGFEIKTAVLVKSENIENSKAATNMVFANLKARLKWQEFVTSKLPGAIKELANCCLCFRGFKVIIELINQQAT